MKRIFKIALIAIALILSVAPMSDAKVKRTKHNSAAKLSTNLNKLMKAPIIKTNAEGFYIINRDAPRSLPHIKTTTSQIKDSERSAKIYIDGKLFQTVTYEANLDETMYLDANFDGYVDILFGAAFYREFGSIFLWDPNLKKFVRAEGKDDFNGLMLINPSKKELYSFLSFGITICGYSISQWNGNKLEMTEVLNEIKDLSHWTNEGYRKKYNVIKGNYDEENIRPYLIMETDDLSCVPSRWRAIMDNINACFEE